MQHDPRLVRMKKKAARSGSELPYIRLVVPSYAKRGEEGRPRRESRSRDDDVEMQRLAKMAQDKAK